MTKYFYGAKNTKQTLPHITSVERKRKIKFDEGIGITKILKFCRTRIFRRFYINYTLSS